MVEIIKAAVFDSSRIFKSDIKTPERTSPCYEIELYVSGVGETYINSKRFPHKKGNLVFARPGTKRCTLNRFVCLYIYLNADDATEKFLADIPPVINTFDYHGYENLFLEIIKLYERSDPGSAMLMQSKIYKLFDMILTDSKMHIRNSGKLSCEVILKAIEYIEKNLANRITLNDIAKSVSFSPIYFHKAFSEYMGKTPHEYISEKRLEAAKMYLLTTDYSMEQIVSLCGFSSHSYFDYHFKKANGITPSQFRKRKYSF